MAVKKPLKNPPPAKPRRLIVRLMRYGFVTLVLGTIGLFLKVSFEQWSKSTEDGQEMTNFGTRLIDTVVKLGRGSKPPAAADPPAAAPAIETAVAPPPREVAPSGTRHAAKPAGPAKQDSPPNTETAAVEGAGAKTPADPTAAFPWPEAGEVPTRKVPEKDALERDMPRKKKN